MNETKTNQKLGTKWFTFYTKVRPWLACLMVFSVIVDFVQYINVYVSNWWMLLYFFAAVAQPILSVIVLVKSSGDYGDFFRFVKGVLLFETINMAYQQGIQQYINSNLEIGTALVTFVVVFVISYFVWYRLNVKYFEKRINVIIGDYLEEDPNRITECKSCGYQDKNYFNACPKCGKYAKQYVYLNQSSTDSKDVTENTLSAPNLDIDKTASKEVAECLIAEQLDEKHISNKVQEDCTSIVRYCIHCGKPLDTNSNFCGYCGTQVYRKG